MDFGFRKFCGRDNVWKITSDPLLELEFVGSTLGLYDNGERWCFACMACILFFGLMDAIGLAIGGVFALGIVFAGLMDLLLSGLTIPTRNLGISLVLRTCALLLLDCRVARHVHQIAL